MKLTLEAWSPREGDARLGREQAPHVLDECSVSRGPSAHDGSGLPLAARLSRRAGILKGRYPLRRSVLAQYSSLLEIFRMLRSTRASITTAGWMRFVKY